MMQEIDNQCVVVSDPTNCDERVGSIESLMDVTVHLQILHKNFHP